MHPLIVALLLGLLGCGGGTTGASAPAPPGPSARATAPMHPSGLDVVLLGTGTPVADPARHGPSTGLVFGGRGLVVDTGPGVVRRLAEAAKLHGQPALEPGNVGLVLLTHLHSDHTTGLPDLIFVIDVKKEDLAILEAKKLGIPVVAVVDTNCSPDGVDYIIPGNDDAARAISLYCDLVSRAALDGMTAQMEGAGVDLGALEEGSVEEALTGETEVEAEAPVEALTEEVAEG